MFKKDGDILDVEKRHEELTDAKHLVTNGWSAKMQKLNCGTKSPYPLRRAGKEFKSKSLLLLVSKSPQVFQDQQVFLRGCRPCCHTGALTSWTQGLQSGKPQ